MCAGATVWNCFHRYGVRPTERVGVMGFGGLGHLAVKIAAEMGCHVVVLSRSDAKREDSMTCGASEYHVFDPAVQRNGIEGFAPLKHLMLCGNCNVDYTS
jgi:D-arabinose 1-dehydrogenase-like Zn-dependent alcohol dehydrogenase